MRFGWSLLFASVRCLRVCEPYQQNSTTRQKDRCTHTQWQRLFNQYIAERTKWFYDFGGGVRWFYLIFILLLRFPLVPCSCRYNVAYLFDFVTNLKKKEFVFFLFTLDLVCLLLLLLLKFTCKQYHRPNHSADVIKNGKYENAQKCIRGKRNHYALRVHMRTCGMWSQFKMTINVNLKVSLFPQKSSKMS